MSMYKREIDRQCCNQWMNGIRTINNQYPDDNREFTIIAGPGIKIEPTTAGIRITNDGDPNSFIAGDNIEFVDNGDGTITVRLKDNQIRTGSTALTGDVAITGDVQVNGDIVQQGSAYETHAEKVFTTNDYITMRDGAVAALAPGDYSGFQVEKYDGTNDGRLVIDNTGTARVGDVGDEQPLLTREESTDLDNGDILTWDANDSKAKGMPITDLAMTKIPIARCWTISNNVAQNTLTNLVFSNNATNDNDVFSVSNGVITTKKTGIYLVICSIAGSVTSATRVELTFKHDSTNEYYYNIQEITLTGTNQGAQAMFVVNETSINHTYQMQIWTSGSDIYTSNAGTSSFFHILYLG